MLQESKTNKIPNATPESPTFQLLVRTVRELLKHYRLLLLPLVTQPQVVVGKSLMLKIPWTSDSGPRRLNWNWPESLPKHYLQGPYGSTQAAKWRRQQPCLPSYDSWSSDLYGTVVECIPLTLTGLKTYSSERKVLHVTGNLANYLRLVVMDVRRELDYHLLSQHNS